MVVGLLLLLLPEKFPAIELWMVVVFGNFFLSNSLLADLDSSKNDLVLYIVAIFPFSPRDILRSSRLVVRGQEG